MKMRPNPEYPLAKYELMLTDKTGKILYGCVIPHRFNSVPPPQLTPDEFDEWVRKNTIKPWLEGP